MLGSQCASFIALFVFAYASWVSEYDCGPQENVSVGSSRWLRMTIFLLSSTLVGTCAIITLVSVLKMCYYYFSLIYYVYLHYFTFNNVLARFHGH